MNVKFGQISCFLFSHTSTHQYAMDWIPSEISRGSLQEPPVSAFIIGYMSLHLIIYLLIGQEHAFYPCHLGMGTSKITRKRCTTNNHICKVTPFQYFHPQVNKPLLLLTVPELNPAKRTSQKLRSQSNISIGVQ